MTAERRIGVYVCHCGGNISDYVDVDASSRRSRTSPASWWRRDTMFACSDATQQEIVARHRGAAARRPGRRLLLAQAAHPHLPRRGAAGRAQPLRVHPGQHPRAGLLGAHRRPRRAPPRKAISLVRAGIARDPPLRAARAARRRDDASGRWSIGGGDRRPARRRSASPTSGSRVFLVEREQRARRLGRPLRRRCTPTSANGRELIARLVARGREAPVDHGVHQRRAGRPSRAASATTWPSIRVNTDLPRADPPSRSGSIVVATGFDSYEPEAGEFGYGIAGVLTLPEFKSLVDGSAGAADLRRPAGADDRLHLLRRQPRSRAANEYCSRFCCAAAVHASLQVADRDAEIHQYHLYRDIRTYGKYELHATPSPASADRST